jgi:hypothetical protein
MRSDRTTQFIGHEARDVKDGHASGRDRDHDVRAERQSMEALG